MIAFYVAIGFTSSLVRRRHRRVGTAEEECLLYDVKKCQQTALFYIYIYNIYVYIIYIIYNTRMYMWYCADHILFSIILITVSNWKLDPHSQKSRIASVV